MKIQTTLEKVNTGLQAIQNKGGKVDIEKSGGTVRIQGVYAKFNFNQSTKELSVSIIDKPWLVSEEYIEEKIKDYFN